MKTVFDNAMCAHVWAQQTQSEGRSNSMRFEGDTSYSYQTPIARIIATISGEKAALITSHSYSSTTSSKHMPAVNRAVTHLLSFRVPDLGIASGRAYASGDMHKTNMQHYIDSYAAALLALSRSRDKSEWRMDQLTAILGQAKRYVYSLAAKRPPAGYWQRNFPAPTPAQLAQTKDKAAKASAQKAKETRQRKQQASEELEPQLQAWLKGELPDLPWRFLMHANADQLARFQAREVDLWRQGNLRQLSGPHRYAGGARLRISGDEVETSQGARFPVKHAIRVFPLLLQAKTASIKIISPVQYGLPKLGHFVIDSVTEDGTVKAGCHIVQWPEIELLARELGLVA